jgi:hypothetical protein
MRRGRLAATGWVEGRGVESAETMHKRQISDEIRALQKYPISSDGE